MGGNATPVRIRHGSDSDSPKRRSRIVGQRLAPEAVREANRVISDQGKEATGIIGKEAEPPAKAGEEQRGHELPHRLFFPLQIPLAQFHGIRMGRAGERFPWHSKCFQGSRAVRRTAPEGFRRRGVPPAGDGPARGAVASLLEIFERENGQLRSNGARRTGNDP